MTEAKRVPLLRWHSPAIVAGLFCCVLTAMLAFAIKAKTQGLFVYPLDDSYIHLALARTLATHHVWGINPTEFASASSSPGWTLILALLDKLIGTHLATPIFLNLFLVFCVLLVADHALVALAPRTSLRLRYATSFLIVLGTPLTSLTLIGMEHVAQTLSILLLVLLATQILATDPTQTISGRKTFLLLATAAFAGTIRYEAVFAIAPIFVLLLWRRRFALATLLALCSAIGPVGFGLYFHHHSGFWLPFSVVAKATLDGGLRKNLPLRLPLLAYWRDGIPPLLTLLPIWLLRLRHRSFWNPSQLFLFLTLLISGTHLAVAPIGWLMRYESYFVCLSILSLTLSFSLATWPGRVHESWLELSSGHRLLTAVAVFGLLLLIPSFARRLFHGTVSVTQAAVDRYNEHIQMANFIAVNYDHDTVVLDDIGAVAFSSHAHLLDMIGLGSIEPLLPWQQGRDFTAVDMERWATSQHASIAILQDEGVGRITHLTPSSWTRVQTWRLPRNIIFADSDVSFYAITPSEIPRLCKSLARFPLTPNDKIKRNSCP